MSFLLVPWFYSSISLLFFIIFVFKWLSAKPSKRNLPPSPSKLPIIGNLHQIGPFPHRSLQLLAKKHGSLMLLHFGSVPVLVVSSADNAREIMKTHDLIFSNRPKLSTASKLMYDYKDVLFARYGEYWRQIRSICVLELLSNKRVQSFRAVREEETALLINKIKENYCSSSSSLNLSEMLVSLTNDVVCRVALGRKYSGKEGGRKFKEILGEFSELLGASYIGDYISWLGWWTRINGLDAKIERLAKTFDEFFEGVVEEHIDGQKRAKNDGGSVEDEVQQDFVDILLEIQRDNIEDSSPLYRDSIKALVLDMFAAGTETTFTALEWTMTELIRHPRVMKELQNEVRGKSKGKMCITEDGLDEMHYLKAVIKETMRLHPPVPLLAPRESTQDVIVMDYDIAAGTRVIINYWAIGRDPLLWEEAEAFRPERFLNTSIDFNGHNFQLIPFGAGRRGCPGVLFATSIIELALANLVHNFEFALPGGAICEDLDIAESTGMSVHKKDPLQVIATLYSF